MRCARSIETTTRDSAISLTVLVLGTSTSMPDCKIGAVIMKITSRTSMTSTKGTILMSARLVPVWRASCGIVVSFTGVMQRLPSAARIRLLNQSGNFHGETIHAHAEVLDLVQKMIV